MTEQPDEAVRVEFKPGWPDIVLHSLIVSRSTVSQRYEDDETENAGDSDGDEESLTWVMHLGLRDDEPKLAFIADLVSTNEVAFGGVTVLLPFSLRNPPDPLDADARDGLLRQYGEWASPIMYDHAAMALRSALAGNGLPLFVPYATQPVILHTSDSFEETEPEA